MFCWTKSTPCSHRSLLPLASFLTISRHKKWTSSGMCYFLSQKYDAFYLNECWQANISRGHKNLRHLTAFKVSVQCLFTPHAGNEILTSPATVSPVGICSVGWFCSTTLPSVNEALLWLLNGPSQGQRFCCLPVELWAAFTVLLETDSNLCCFGTLPRGWWMLGWEMTHLLLEAELCRGCWVRVNLCTRKQSSGLLQEVCG